MEEVHDTTLRKRETKEAQVNESIKLELVDIVQVAPMERKRRKKGFGNGETTFGKKRRRPFKKSPEIHPIGGNILT